MSTGDLTANQEEEETKWIFWAWSSSLFKGSARNNLSIHTGESALFHPETPPHLDIALKDV